MAVFFTISCYSIWKMVKLICNAKIIKEHAIAILVGNLVGNLVGKMHKNV
jgi:hypothetical protein